MSAAPTGPVLDVRDAALRYGRRELWSGLDLALEPGELVAVLGSNGAGKTSLVRCLLGLQPLSAGTVRIAGRPAHRGRSDVGYVPQQRRVDPMVPLRAKDVVGQGLDGHRWGWRPGGRARRAQVRAALEEVGAASYADEPFGLLSGGEQQRVRMAQALVGDPVLLLCDEPLLSLDLRSQATVARLVEQRRRRSGTAVLFVTHEVNPVLDQVDRVLYLTQGRFRLGTVDEVLTSQSLSELYRTPVDVVRSRGRLVVVGAPDAPEQGHPHDLADQPDDQRHDQRPEAVAS